MSIDQPALKFVPPSGWQRGSKGGLTAFAAPDSSAMLAYTTFSGSDTSSRVASAVSALGVQRPTWRTPARKNVGREQLAAEMGEGSCTFRGPNGYVFYAAVDGGGSDRLLFVYVASSSASSTSKQAVLAAINSVQKR